jgi:hypothetical protein
VQADPTPFGPIHIESGPSLADVRGPQPGYLTTGMTCGLLIPIGTQFNVIRNGIMVRTQLHHNQQVKWGTVGLGISTGISELGADDESINNYRLLSIPVAFNIRYTALAASPWFWSVDLSSGMMINIIDIYGNQVQANEIERVTASKVFFAPSLNIGRRVFNRWRASIYAGYLMILFDAHFLSGIASGLRVEYTFGTGGLTR